MPLQNIILKLGLNEVMSKILAIHFKYFGDAVLMTPALRAIREHFPQCELHALVPGEIAPILEHLPWLNRIWAMPRRRGSANLSQTLPIIGALRRERFDRSVDFVSNDRGAIASLLIGAKERLGWLESGGFWGRRFCYTRRVAPEIKRLHESAHLVHLLSGWDVPPPRSLEPEIRADPALAEAAKKVLPIENAVICHVASSQPNREWPLSHWAALHRLATAAGYPVVFTTPRGKREQSLVPEFIKLAPNATVLPMISELPLFLAVLQRAAVFISGDTGPLHFAAGLGVPTISLFGPSLPERWAPVGPRHRLLTGTPCSCGAHSAICTNKDHCLAAISPEQVLNCLQKADQDKRRSPHT
jgi:ADP-heptose:LPS heptosyltransferase